MPCDRHDKGRDLSLRLSSGGDKGEADADGADDGDRQGRGWHHDGGRNPALRHTSAGDVDKADTDCTNDGANNGNGQAAASRGITQGWREANEEDKIIINARRDMDEEFGSSHIFVCFHLLIAFRAPRKHTVHLVGECMRTTPAHKCSLHPIS